MPFAHHVSEPLFHRTELRRLSEIIPTTPHFAGGEPRRLMYVPAKSQKRKAYVLNFHSPDYEEFRRRGVFGSYVHLPDAANAGIDHFIVTEKPEKRNYPYLVFRVSIDQHKPQEPTVYYGQVGTQVENLSKATGANREHILGLSRPILSALHGHLENPPSGIHLSEQDEELRRALSEHLGKPIAPRPSQRELF